MELFPDRIETDRLALEAAGPETVDTFALYDICSGETAERVTEHLTWGPHPHPKETRDFLAAAAEEREAGEAVHYAVRPREGEDGAGDLAGFCGLTVDWDRRLGEPGVWLRPPFWGRGYSGERARALAWLAFDRLDLGCLAVEVRAGNDRSLSAVESYVEALGGRHEGLCRHAGAWGEGPVDLHRFTVTCAEYDAADPDRPVTVEG